MSLALNILTEAGHGIGEPIEGEIAAGDQMLQNAVALILRNAEAGRSQLDNGRELLGIQHGLRTLPHSAHRLGESCLRDGSADGVFDLQHKGVVVCQKRLIGVNRKVLITGRGTAYMVTACLGVIDHHAVGAYQTVDQRLDGTEKRDCYQKGINCAVANQKGGVGKTTTSQALAAGLAAKGYRVLGIDLDPQGNFSTACGAENYNVQTIYEVMKRAASIQEAVQHTKGGYDVVPANIMLAGAEQELSQTGKEHRLKEAVAPIAADYDFIVIDTPPSLGVLTVNAFTCATDILIPTTAGIFATAGISQLNETVTSVQKYCNPNVKIRGILFTKFNPRANISRQMKELAEQLSEYIAAPIYETYIRSAVVVEEAQANRQDIFDYANRSTVSEDYKAFIEEFLKGVKE